MDFLASRAQTFDRPPLVASVDERERKHKLEVASFWPKTSLMKHDLPLESIQFGYLSLEFLSDSHSHEAPSGAPAVSRSVRISPIRVTGNE